MCADALSASSIRSQTHRDSVLPIRRAAACECRRVAQQPRCAGRVLLFERRSDCRPLLAWRRLGSALADLEQPSIRLRVPLGSARGSARSAPHVAVRLSVCLSVSVGGRRRSPSLASVGGCLLRKRPSSALPASPCRALGAPSCSRSTMSSSRRAASSRVSSSPNCRRRMRRRRQPRRS